MMQQQCRELCKANIHLTGRIDDMLHQHSVLAPNIVEALHMFGMMNSVRYIAYI